MSEKLCVTKWSEDVDKNLPLNDYPRPQMVREDWMNLNGLWDFYLGIKSSIDAVEFDKEIVVPFCVESQLSGVMQKVLPEDYMYYRRSFSLPKTWKSRRIILHFGAVDWNTTIYVNGQEVGNHQGGYTSFEIDITNYLREHNELIVEVQDPTDSFTQQKGKQSLNPSGIFYTATSGIWQTVWLEPVSEHHIKSIKMTPEVDDQMIRIELIESGKEMMIKEINIIDAEQNCVATSKSMSHSVTLSIPEPKLWSPTNPYLYTVEIEVIDQGQIIDKIGGYFGMRKFDIVLDSANRKKFTLNDEVIFYNGILDQGYWPEGIYTAPTDEALKSDIETAKKMGFNMIRKHIKVEPARWYYWCDRLGIVVWQDMINGGKLAFEDLIPKMMSSGQLEIPEKVIVKMQSGDEVSTTDMMSIIQQVVANIDEDTSEEWYGYVGRDHDSRKMFEAELKEIIDQLYNVTSIGLWVPFNESWGQFDAKRIGDWVTSYDKTRQVDYHSGWVDTGGGEVRSFHTYCAPLEELIPDENRLFVISEFGGNTLLLGDKADEKIFSYGHHETSHEFTKAYSLLMNEVSMLKNNGLGAVVYTQLTDVESELNGLMTYDRRAMKINPIELKKFNTT